MVARDGRKLGWGLVSCGWVARDYVAPAIATSSNGRLAAVHDHDPAAMARVSGSVARCHEDLEALLASPDVEAVYVATPNHAHASVVEASARAGKAVLCEKPMATTLEDARRMVQACEAAGVRLATAYDQRFHAAHRRLRDLVSSGALGTVAQARIHYACWLPPDWSADNWRIDPRRAGGGAMIDLAPHGVDLLEVLLGDQWAELRAITQSVAHPYAVDDGAVLMGRFQRGALATIHVGYNCPDPLPRRRLELIGTRAMAVAIDTMGQTPGGRLTLIDAASGADRDESPPPDDDPGPFRAQVEAFAAAVLGGEPFPYPAARDLRNFALLEAAACR